MYKGKRILAIIPARGGSKGLPGKNIRELCGKPQVMSEGSVKAPIMVMYLCLSPGYFRYSVSF